MCHLEPADTLVHRRLCDVELGRRPTAMPFAIDGDEGSDQAEFQLASDCGTGGAALASLGRLNPSPEGVNYMLAGRR